MHCSYFSSSIFLWLQQVSLPTSLAIALDKLLRQVAGEFVELAITFQNVQQIIFTFSYYQLI